jgi:group I intron endonuclease
MVQFKYNGLSKSSGIYKITNSHNSRIYFGSCKEFKRRWNTGHYQTLLNGKHSNRFLQADFDKCNALLGHDDFLQFEVIQHMPGSTKSQRLDAEEKWLEIYYDGGKSCYNLTKYAYSREGSAYKNPAKTKERMILAAQKRAKDPQTLAKISATHKRIGTVPPNCVGRPCSAETRQKLSKALRGLKRSLETRQNISLGKKGKPHSEEHKRKIRESTALYFKNNPRSKQIKMSLIDADPEKRGVVIIDLLGDEEDIENFGIETQPEPKKVADLPPPEPQLQIIPAVPIKKKR